MCSISLRFKEASAERYILLFSSFLLSRFVASSFCPNSTIWRSFCVLVSKFNKNRTNSNMSGFNSCASSIKSTGTFPLTALSCRNAPKSVKCNQVATHKESWDQEGRASPIGREIARERGWPEGSLAADRGQ